MWNNVFATAYLCAIEIIWNPNTYSVFCDVTMQLKHVTGSGNVDGFIHVLLFLFLIGNRKLLAHYQ